MKRVLVCGSNGLLGQRLAYILDGESEYEVLHTSHHRSFVNGQDLFDYTQLDISNRGDVKSLISSFRPDVVLNAAAMTNVDHCERDREQAWKINVTGVEHLVEICRRINAKLIHVSTDYVFDGKNGNYKEEDRVNPINYYGKTKLAGENVIVSSGIDYAILRTILVYGIGVNVKNNFALWVINNLNDRKQIRCADDQVSCPTHVHDLAMAIKNVMERNVNGMLHISGPEIISRYDFAIRAAEIFGYDKSLILRVKTADLEQRAARPLNTSFILDKAKIQLRYTPMNITQGLMMMQHDLTGINLN
jgi:dTDP-4-dehydrorhamnose reductase